MASAITTQLPKPPAIVRMMLASKPDWVVLVSGWTRQTTAGADRWYL